MALYPVGMEIFERFVNELGPTMPYLQHHLLVSRVIGCFTRFISARLETRVAYWIYINLNQDLIEKYIKLNQDILDIEVFPVKLSCKTS